MWSEKLPFAEYSVEKELSTHSGVDPSVARDNQCSPANRNAIKPALEPAAPAEALTAPTLASEPFGSQEVLENTGLEPVTSWLQTRRSPS